MKKHVIAVVVMLVSGLVLPAAATDSLQTIRLGVERTVANAVMQKGNGPVEQQAQLADEKLQDLAQSYPQYEQDIQAIRLQHEGLVKILRKSIDMSSKRAHYQHVMFKMEDMASRFQKWEREEDPTDTTGSYVREQCRQALDHLYEYQEAGNFVGLNVVATDVYEEMSKYVVDSTGLPGWGNFYNSFSKEKATVK